MCRTARRRRWRDVRGATTDRAAGRTRHSRVQQPGGSASAEVGQVIRRTSRAWGFADAPIVFLSPPTVKASCSTCGGCSSRRSNACGGGGIRTPVPQPLNGASPSAAGVEISGSPLVPASVGNPSQLRVPARPADVTGRASPARWRPGPARRAETGGTSLLVRQRVRTQELSWHLLFLPALSRGLRQPRLASPASTTKVEAMHPRALSTCWHHQLQGNGPA